MNLEIVSADILYEGMFTVRKAKVLTPSGELIEREFIEAPSGAAILPYDPARGVALLITQPRVPVLNESEPAMLEVIAGALDGDEPQACAKREALEEAGLRVRELEHVASVWASPANSNERVDYYLAAYGADDRVGSGGGLAEEHEHISVCEVPLSTLETMLNQGQVRDVKTLVLVQALRLRHPQLFTVQAAAQFRRR